MNKQSNTAGIPTDEEVYECLTKHMTFLAQFDRSQMIDHSINYGRLGLAALMFQHWKLTSDDVYYQQAMDIINETISCVEKGTGISIEEVIDFSIFIELAKKNRLLDVDTNQILNKLDGTIYSILEQYIKEGNFDLTGGALKLGHYFLLRYESTPAVEKYLLFLLNQTIESSLTHAKGIYWKSHLHDFKHAYFGYHGSAAFITFLSKLIAKNIQPEDSRKTLEKASAFVAGHYQTTEDVRFPIVLGNPNHVSMLELVYSDLLPAYSMLVAGKTLENTGLQEIGEQSLIHSACLMMHEAAFRDVGIAYGICGAANVFMDAEKISKLITEKQLAGRCIARVLQEPFYDHELRLSYTAFDKTRGLSSTLGFLTGTIGIATTLLRYLNPSFDFPSQLLFVD